MVTNIPKRPETILQMNAKEIAKGWSSSGFKLTDGVYATGRYAPNSKATSVSPSIALPDKSGDEHIYLQINSKFETERNYDYVKVLYSEDEGKNYKRILRRSGSTDFYTDYVDITPLAGKNVRFKLELSSDSTNEGSGWEIQSVSVVKDNPDARSSLRSLDLSMRSAIAKLQYLGFAQNEYPNKLSVYFTARTASGKFVENISLSDIKVYWKGQKVDSKCLKMAPLTRSSNLPVDIAFLMDNSSSMSDEVEGVRKNVLTLTNQLRNLNSRIGTYYFGHNDCKNRVKAFYEGDGISTFYATLSPENLVGVKNYANFENIWQYDITGTRGGTEPYYSILWDMVEQQNLNYRTNSQKVLILIGDECAYTYNNQYDCVRGNKEYTSADKQPLVEALKSNGFQLFTIVDNNNGFGDSELPWNERSFTGMADATGGLDIDIESNTNYSAIFNMINKTITERYVLTVDLNSCGLNASDPNIEITIENDGNIITTGEINMNASAKGKLDRTPSTIVYDTKGVDITDANTTKIGAYVRGLDGGVQVESMHIYVKLDNEQNYTELSGVTKESDGWYGYVPSSMITPNAVIDYRFRAELSNGDYILSSPEGTEPYDYWTLTVLPNTPPSISHDVDIQIKGICQPLTVETTITDNGSVQEAMIWYRKGQSVDEYTMAKGKANGTHFVFEIPSDFSIAPGFEYFIQAIDNLGAKTTYGTENLPLTKEIVDNLPYQQTGKISNISIKTNNYNCSNFEKDDELFVYTDDGCGNQMLIGSYKVDEKTKQINQFPILLNSSSNQNKDGINIGDFVTIKLKRADEILDVTPSYNNRYWTLSRPLYADMPSTPEISVKGNYRTIEKGSITCHTENNTDFGYTNQARTNSFEITNYSGCGEIEIYNIKSSSEHITITKTISSVPNGASAWFDVTYDGLADASAKITIESSSGDYTFNVEGRTLKGNTSCDGITFSNPVNNSNHGIYITTAVEGHLYVYAVDVTGKIVAIIFNGRMHKGNNIQLDLYGLYSSVSKGEYYIVVEREGMPFCSNPIFVEK